MGWIKDAKNESMRKDAQAALDEGAIFFTPILNMPSGRAGGAAMSGRVVDWEQMMAVIVETGWRLHTWAVVADPRGHVQAQPLFIR